VDPELQNVADFPGTNYPLGWRDARFKMDVLPAIGGLRCGASKKFLLGYLAMSEAEARELAPPQFEEATRGLLKQDLTGSEMLALLRHPHSGVRGTAILEFIDRPTPPRRQALKEAAPWALELPAARW